jgi:opacity protein-like surface antigen
MNRYAFSNAWSVKLEYLHVDLGDKTQRLFVNSTQGIDVKTDNKFDIIRAGVNFRF